MDFLATVSAAGVMFCLVAAAVWIAGKLGLEAESESDSDDD